MKNSLKYSELWRKKREELPVDSEAQMGWQEMQSLLDIHLPVIPGAPVAHVSKLSQILKAIKTIKATSVLIISLTIATVTGITVYWLSNNQHKDTSTHQHKNQNHITGRDSLTDSLTTNTLNVNDSSGFVKDSSGSSDLSGTQSRSVNRADNIDNIGNAPVNGTKSQANKSSLPTATINNQQPASLVPKSKAGYVNNAKGKQISIIVHNNHRSVIAAKNQNNNPIGSVGNQAINNHLSIEADASASNDSQGYQTIQNGNPVNNRLILSASSTQSWQLTSNSDNTFQPQLFTGRSLSGFLVNSYANTRPGPVAKNSKLSGKTKTGKNQSVKSTAAKGSGKSLGKSLSAGFSDMDWGILLGVNSSGSFTPKAQNHNFYGSLPVDIYPGLFGTYHINNKWAVNAQVRFLTPLNLSGTYTNQSDNVDSARSIKVTDSRKAYFVTVPIHAVYKITDNISIKGGPVINILAKQVSFNTSAQKIFDNVDTLFFQSKESQVKTTTRYNQKINLGLSGGVSIQANRFIFEAVYQKNLSGYNVISDFHNYKNNPGSLQLSIGFKLNSSKHH